jgi:hypothetical protein
VEVRKVVETADAEVQVSHQEKLLKTQAVQTMAPSVDRDEFSRRVAIRRHLGHQVTKTHADVHTHRNRRYRSRSAQYHMEMSISNINRDKSFVDDLNKAELKVLEMIKETIDLDGFLQNMQLEYLMMFQF